MKRNKIRAIFSKNSLALFGGALVLLGLLFIYAIWMTIFTA